MGRVIAAQITRLVFLRQWAASSDLMYPIAFHTAVVMQTTLAVIVACIPALKPFSKHTRAQRRFSCLDPSLTHSANFSGSCFVRIDVR